MPEKISAGEMNACCPFYVRDGRRSITCEGAEPGSQNRTVFSDPAAKERFLQRECCVLPAKSRCAYGAMLMRRYESGG